MSPAISVMVRDLGHEDSIVACHDFDLILSDDVPRAGSELAWDTETLVSADLTHLIFQRTSAKLPQALRSLADDRGWTIIERSLNTLDDVAVCMDDLYYMLEGAPERGAREYDIEEALDHTPPSERLARSWRDRGPRARDAGRVLLLGSVDPIAAVGPGSFHHQLIERMGMTPAITQGAMWIELSAEDVIGINPDSILLVAPRTRGDADRFGAPEPVVGPDAEAALKYVADLPTRAAESGRLGVCAHPLGLLPSSALGEVADEIDLILESWGE